MGFAVNVLDPGNDSVERMGLGIGNGRWQIAMLRKPFQVALGRKDRTGFTALDAVEQFAGAGPFRRLAFAGLRTGLPISLRSSGQDRIKCRTVRACLNAGIQRVNGVKASRSRSSWWRGEQVGEIRTANQRLLQFPPKVRSDRLRPGPGQ